MQNYFAHLSGINVSDHIEKKGGYPNRISASIPPVVSQERGDGRNRTGGHEDPA